ncbi:hypothetical protein AVEN_219382-1 [Araneus ventricosus]|uniref:Uncharacterized protein n=1 Tax=Araneus ventricosus TaxID=182803 RepID=A0A4Y2BFA6_ARAVE|nr:hypothetical protein AVEN_219382-1 [Araneus ventricosus]
MYLVILNHGQMKRTTPELAPHLQTSTPHQHPSIPVDSKPHGVVSCWALRSGLTPSLELKAVEVSYARALYRISPLTLSDIEPLEYESRCTICW